MTNSKKKLDNEEYDVTKDPVIITLAALTSVVIGIVFYSGVIEPLVHRNYLTQPSQNYNVSTNYSINIESKLETKIIDEVKN